MDTHTPYPPIKALESEEKLVDKQNGEKKKEAPRLLPLSLLSLSPFLNLEHKSTVLK